MRNRDLTKFIHRLVDTNILQRVFCVRCPGGSGSSVVLDLDQKQYLVTADHVLGTPSACASDQLRINIAFNGTWQSFPAILVGRDSHRDVAVIALPHQVARKDTPLEFGSLSGTILGQEVRILGFPYGTNSWRTHSAPESPWPLPFVKAGIISNFFIEDPQAPLYLDIQGNVGFSGGPVVVIPIGTDEDEAASTWKVIGIVRGAPYEPSVDDAGAKEAPGFVVATSVECVRDLIERNPIGCPALR